MVFPARRCAGLPSAGFPKEYASSVNLSGITFTDAGIDPRPKGVEGTIWTIRDTAVALYSTAAGPATNQAALDDLATRAAQDFFDSRSVRFDKVYSGINSIPPNALIDVISFVYTSTTQTTRIRSLPFGGEARESQHQDPAISACHADDRNPGVLLDIPGGAPLMSMTGVVSLEDGRLVLTYDATTSVPCSCTPFVACGTICVRPLGCNGLRLPQGISVSASGGGGTSGTPCTTTGQVSSVAVVNHGSGYTGAPAVSFAAGEPPGSGAAGHSVLSTTSVASIALVAAGSGYTTAPAVTVSGGGGAGCTARALLTATTVSQVNVVAAGSGYTGLPTVTLTTPTGHTGSGATASPSMAVATVLSIAAGGSTYAVNDLLTVSGGTASVAAILKVTAVAGGAVTAAVVDTAGVYTALPSNPVSATYGGAGSGATFNLRYKVDSFTITAAGTNYSTAPTVGITLGGGSGATATATVAATTVDHVTVITPGSAFTSAPGVTFTPTGPGSGAAATAVLNARTVASVVVDAGGTGYAGTVSAFAVAFSGGGGTGATATAGVLAQCCASIATASTYTITLAHPPGSGFDDDTYTFAASCSANISQPTWLTANINAAYACTLCSAYPVKRAATLTIGGTAYTLTFGGGSPVTTWSATFTVPVATAYVHSGAGASCSGGGSTTVTVTVRCASGGGWELLYGFDVGRCFDSPTGGNSVVTGHGGCGNWYPVGTTSDGGGTVSAASTTILSAATTPISYPTNITFSAFPATVSVCCCPADDLSGNYGFTLPNILSGTPTLTE